MAEQFPTITDELKQFIEQQKIFFVATADRDGRVNVSPKGMDSLRVIDGNRIIWLNYTGSGNETAAHLLAQNRITLMFCSFDKKPLILRLYGQGKAIYQTDSEWSELSAHFQLAPGSRQFFDVTIDLVQTSCGYAVPFFEFISDRDLLAKWAENKGPNGIKDYWQEKNRLSLDGKETGIK